MRTSGREWMIEKGAATCLAAASGYCAYGLLSDTWGQALSVAVGALTAVIAYCLGRQCLAACDRSPAQQPLELTSAPAPVAEFDNLRVVRLFDRTPPSPSTSRDDHIAAQQIAPADASEALREALQQLRHSLRQS